MFRLYRRSSFVLAFALILTMLLPLLTPASAPVHAQSAESLAPPPIAGPGDIPAPTVFDAAGGVSVDPSRRAEVVAFYYNQYQVDQGYPGTIGNASNCSPGSPTTSFRNAVLQRINYFRAMAGVTPLNELDEAASDDAQETALMMSAEGDLSHDPGSGWACYTATGDTTAGESNLSLGVMGWGAIDAYMMDRGGGNYFVGHRRWILYPPSREFGSGDTAPSGRAPANALKVFNLPTGSGATRDGFVAWPPPGHVPFQTVYPRWSFSLDGADFSRASVTVKEGGRTVPVQIVNTGNNGYGLNTIVWTMDGVTDGMGWPNPGEDKTYDIRIGNVDGRAYTYSVTVIDPADAGPTTMDFDKEKSKYNGWVNATLRGFEPGYTITLRWPGGSVLAQVRADGNGDATASFRTPLVPLGTYSVRASDSAGNLALADLRVIPRILLNEYEGPPGMRIRVYFYGFSPGERVQVQWYTSGSRYDVLKTVTIADNGRGTTLMDIPDDASIGEHTIRGKVIGVGRSATDSFEVTAPGSSEEPTPTATATGTATPEATAEATLEPTVEPTVEPTTEPTTEPTLEPTTGPTIEPTVEPTIEPTLEPTVEPTATVEPPATETTPAEPTATEHPDPAEQTATEPPAEPATPDPT